MIQPLFPLTSRLSLEMRENLMANSLISQLHMKVTQRIALSQLRPCVANWRYQKTNSPVVETRVEVDEEQELPEELEQLIETLLAGLRNRVHFFVIFF